MSLSASAQLTATHCNTLKQHCNTQAQGYSAQSTHTLTRLRCNSLPLTATHYNTLHLTATYYSTLQYTATTCSNHCNTLQQHTHYNNIHTPQHAHAARRRVTACKRHAARTPYPVCAATHCPSLPLNATHCNTLQHTATHCNTHCNTLQHTAPHCNNIHTPQHVHARHKVKRHGQHAARTPYPVCAATHCYSRPLTATYCKTLQHTATH